MIRIAITHAAFEAIAATLPLGNVVYAKNLKLRRGRDRDPGRESSEDMEAPRGGRDQRGASALQVTIAVRHDDASPHKWGGDRGNRSVPERGAGGHLTKFF
jgi:hypothetical protein